MIMAPPYNGLATCQDWQVGEAVIENGYAAVLVSTVSQIGDVAAFRFLLHRHEEAPYSGCWLTEAVLALDQSHTPEDTFSRGERGSSVE